jgi:Fe-S-cluster containining protein
MMDRCTGHCCRAFTLPWTLEEMKIAYKRDLAHMMKARAGGATFPTPDTVKVYPLLIPLAKERGNHPLGPARQSGTRYYYTCKFFKDGNCTNYEHRPKMCSSYPEYSGNALCEYEGCTWAGHRGLRARKLRVYEEPGGCKPEFGELLTKEAEAA